VPTNPPFGGREEDGIENNFPTFRTKETADLFLALIVRLLKADGRAAVVLPDGTLFGERVKTRLSASARRTLLSRRPKLQYATRRSEIRLEAIARVYATRMNAGT
jgi:type I restriction-modification system DNA methylase subunit